MNQQPAVGCNAEGSSGPGGYLQNNYHIDGNLYSVLTPSAHADKAPKTTKTRGRRKARWKLKFHHQALPPEYREHYEAATEAASVAGPFPSTSSSMLSTPTTPKVGKEDNPVSKPPRSAKKVALPATSSPAVIMPSPPPPIHHPGFGRNTELPYMGEITLDSKPRRGRKPKKADICHLIYKNYGTVFPSPKTNTSEVLNNVEIKPKISWTKEREEKKKLLHDSLALKKSSGSLLEKRLTASASKLSSETSVESVQNRLCDNNKLSKTQSSLCDYLMNKNKESSESRASSSSKTLSDVESNRDPSLAQACVQRLLAYAAGLDEQNEPLNLCMRDHLKVEPSSCSESDPEEITKLPPGLSPIETSQPGGYVFWPSAGVFVHPQLLYKPTSPAQAPIVVSPSTSQKVIKKKRKRSAIFIPPAESPTEVSICKFKFTGGAKPSLEEKKMLSVDAGGNFRFYSGTDKGMRSFLPHLQHSPILSSSNNASPSRKVTLHSSDDILQPSPSSAPKLPMDLPPLHHAPPSPQDRKSLTDSKRKRKSRKSEVREKLEQTFKEKGFLIQTQQLESAEGATYCKFRQLRKFTRYLFRSWRDYLPHSIQDLSQANQEQQILPQDCVSVSLGDASLHSSNASS